MQYLNYTIQRGKQGLLFSEGQPDELGLEQANEYVFFLYSRVQVRVWLADEITSDEHRLISHKILEMVKSRIVEGNSAYSKP